MSTVYTVHALWQHGWELQDADESDAVVHLVVDELNAAEMPVRHQ